MAFDQAFADTNKHKTCAACGTTFFRDRRCTWKHWERAKFCSRQCSANQWAKVAERRRPSIKDAFAMWHDKPDGCWEWKGARDKDGYGIFTYEAKTYRAAIMALVLSGVERKPGRYACHTCDNPSCVRPDHLYFGSPSDNVADAMQRGRMKVGSAHGAAKLTEEAVYLIRRGGFSDREFADLFGVTAGAVSMARRKITWRHVL